MIRIDEVWLAVEPLDLRAGTESALAKVVAVFGAAHPHHAYLFANKRANRMKVLVHDGIGVWLAARRLNSGKFVWPKDGVPTLTLARAQFDALVLGLPAHFNDRGRPFRRDRRRRFSVIVDDHGSTRVTGFIVSQSSTMPPAGS
ncbi:MAG: IS66 family insertion sequence element accessory protein TnpB [Ideonella sp.]|nr:IS66 family insertion sequence element accessory protein TnpB [Ideonella sp.]